MTDQASPRPPRNSTRKVALVTGAAKRVGRQIALRLAQAGYDVAITYQHSAADAQRVCQELENLGSQSIAIEVDFAQPQADQVVYEQWKKSYNRLDVLVNNASCFDPSTFGSLTSGEWDRQMAVNARAPALLIQRFVQQLAQHYDENDPTSLGRVVNFVDIHVLGQPLKKFLAYNVSKAALLEVTMTLAMELAPKITVNAIAPGVVCWADNYTEHERQLYMKRVPLARPGTPTDAADAVLFLAQSAHYCTGQVLKLDGGRLLT